MIIFQKCNFYGEINVSLLSKKLQVLQKSEAVLERPENVSVAFGEDAVFSCKTHKALREFTSWVRLTGNDIIELEEGTEVLRIHNVTESDLVRPPKSLTIL